MLAASMLGQTSRLASPLSVLLGISAWRAANGEVAWTSEKFLNRGLSAPLASGHGRIAARTADDIIGCDVATPVSEAVSILATRRIGALPVLRGGIVVGIISERDVIYRLADHGAGCLDLPVEAIITSPAFTV